MVDALYQQKVSLYNLVGLPTLYASAYFLPPLLPMGAYLLPEYALFRLVVLPSLVAVATGMVVLLSCSAIMKRWVSPSLASLISVVGLSIMALIALKGVMEAAGFHWQDRIPRAHDLVAAQQRIRLGVFLGVLAFVWVKRRSLPKVSRLLSSVGLALAAVAVVRLMVLWQSGGTAHDKEEASGFSGSSATVNTYRVAGTREVAGPAAVTGAKARRVVWVIFDETDYGRLIESLSKNPAEVQHFGALARAAVFATRANSPASATLYSIPALLTGVPVDRVVIDSHANLNLHTARGKQVVFGEETSIFAALRKRGQAASVLGFFHPYCKLFKLSRCDAFAWPEIGGLSDALWANVPTSIAAVLHHADPWENISEKSMRLLPDYLRRDDSLTFVHLNIPHLPASFADKLYKLPPSADPLEEYTRNLAFTDQVLGEIMHELELQTATKDMLLVVSTDHWLRNRWYQADEAEVSRPIPLILWKVGDSQGINLSQPVSSVHTASLILDFLGGSISTQAEIAAWWSTQTLDPAYIAPNT